MTGWQLFPSGTFFLFGLHTYVHTCVVGVRAQIDCRAGALEQRCITYKGEVCLGCMYRPCLARLCTDWLVSAAQNEQDGHMVPLSRFTAPAIIKSHVYNLRPNGLFRCRIDAGGLSAALESLIGRSIVSCLFPDGIRADLRGDNTVVVVILTSLLFDSGGDLTFHALTRYSNAAHRFPFSSLP